MALILLLTVQVLNDLDQALKSAADRDPERRIHSLPALAASPDPRSRAALLSLLGDDHPKVRARAARTVRESSDPLPLLRQAVRQPAPRVRQGACDVLGELSGPEPLSLLLDRLSDGDARVQGAAAASLGRRGDPSAAPRLVETFRKDSDWPLRAFAMEAVARLSPDRLDEILDPALADANYQVRLAAASTGRPEALSRLVADRDWRVRAAAIDACRRRRERDSIGLLVEQFPRESGRLRWDILTALQDLTGKSLGFDPKAWTAWWSAARESFDVRPLSRTGAPQPPDPGETQAAFFKVPILSTRLLFVLDLSGSMRDPSPEGPTKLEIAKKGMTETLRSLPPEARFGMLGLGCDAEGAYLHREQKTWQGRPVLLPASPSGKADAEAFVRGLEAKGWTNLYDGIEYAYTDLEVDTIYLYSDGGASKGTFVAAGEILSNLAAMNQFRRIVIHTVEVPGEKNPPDNRRLLQKIAETTGGTCSLYEKKAAAKPTDRPSARPGGPR